MKIKGLTIIIDNYDSFTYNLYQYVCEFSENVQVYRNDQIRLTEIESLAPRYIIISPGPKEPKDAGISKEVIRYFMPSTKILGVCLGHQCLNEVFGGVTIRANKVCHGKTSLIMNDQKYIYQNLPKSFKVARYHSLIVDKNKVHNDLIITATTESGEIMGLRHKKYQLEGVQFHPESFLTEFGKKMIENFYNY